MKTLRIATMIVLSLSLKQDFATAQPSLMRIWSESLPDAWLQFEDLVPINERQAKVQIEGLWGVVDRKGRIIIPTIYGKLSLFSTGRFGFPTCFKVSNDGRKFGLVDSNGGLITPIAFNQFEVIDAGRVRACTSEGVCQEFLSTGEEVTPPVLRKYRCRVRKNAGLTPASLDGLLYGLANDNGGWVIAPRFTNIYNDDYPIWIVDGEKGGYKAVLPQKLDWESPNFKWIRCTWGGFAGTMGDGVWHEYDLVGNEIGMTETEFSYDYYFNNSKPFVFVEKGLQGLSAWSGEVLLPPIFTKISRHIIGSDVFHVVEQADGKHGLFHTDKWVLICQYEKILRSPNAPLFFAITGDSTLVVDTLGEVKATLPFPVRTQNNDVFIVDYLGKRYFWTPESGLVKIPINIEKVSSAYDAVILKDFNNKHSLMDLNGREVLSGFDEIKIPYQIENKYPQYYLLRKNMLWGMIDHSFKFGFEPQYTELKPIGYGRFIVKKGLHFGIVNHKNEELLPFEYEEHRVQDGFLALKKDRKWVLLDIKNIQPVTNPDFDEIGAIGMNYFVGKREGLYTVLDKKGQKIGGNGYSMHPQFYEEGGFSMGEEDHRAFYSAAGVRMTEPVYSGFGFDGKNIGYYLKAILPSGSNVYYDEDLREIIRANDLRIRSNGTLAVMVDKAWQFMDKRAKPISDLFFTILVRIPDNGSDNFFAGQDTNGLWHIVDLAGRSIHQFEAEDYEYNGAYVNDPKLYFIQNGKRYQLDVPGFTAKECKFEFNQMGLVVLKGKVGYVNNLGQLIIPCEYDEIVEPGGDRSTECRLLAAKKDGFYSVYDIYSGKKILEGVSGFTRYDWLSRTFYLKNGQTGIIRPESGEIGEAKFYSFEHSIVGNKSFYTFSLRKKGGMGLLDRNLQQVLPPIYSSIKPIYAGSLLLKDSTGQQLLFDGNKLLEINSTLNVVCTFGEKLLVREKEAFWFVTHEGKKIRKVSEGVLEHKTAIGKDEYALHIKSKGQNYFHYTDERPPVGPIQVKRLQKNNNYLVKMDGKWGLYSLAEGFLAKPVFDSIEENQLGYWMKKGKKWGFTTFEGHPLLAPKYDIKPFFDGHYFIVRKDGAFQYLDVFGKPIFNESYDYALAFSAGLAPVCRNGKWGYIDTKGILAIPFQFEYAHPFTNYFRVTWVMNGDSIHLINTLGQSVDDLPRFPKGVDNEQAYDPTLLWPKEKQARSTKVKSYQHCTVFYDSIERKYGFASYNGREILAPVAESYNWFDSWQIAALAWYKQEGKYGFITHDLKVIPAEYDKYEEVDYRNLRLFKGGEKYLLNKDGQLRQITK